MELEFLLSAISLLIGFGAGYLTWGRRSSSIELVEWPSKAVERIFQASQPSRVVSPGREAVVFCFADGSEEFKTLFKHSIESDMLWRDKLFAQQPSTSEPIIFNEVTY